LWSRGQWRLGTPDTQTRSGNTGCTDDGEIMTVRATFLSLATLFGITLWGMAVYSETSLAGGAAADGYGVSAIAGQTR
jgi:hypothetical protein